MGKIKKRILIVCISLIAAMMLSACSPIELLENFNPNFIAEWFEGLFGSSRSDEQMILDRIDQMVTDYNNGDIDAMMESLAPKTKTLVKSTIGISESIVGGLIGIDLSFTDLFGLSVGLSEGDMLSIQIESIDIRDEDTATVTGTMGLNAGVGEYAASESAAITIVMVKDKSGMFKKDWFVQTIR